MNADAALTVLARTPTSKRDAWLRQQPVSLLRKMADLCGYDAASMTKTEAVNAIAEGF